MRKRFHVSPSSPWPWVIGIGFLLLLVTAGWLIFLRSPAPSSPPTPRADAPYKLASTSIDMRIDDLIQRMTLDEKIGQMALVEKNSIHNINDIAAYGLGGVLSGAGAKPKDNTPKGWQDMITAFQSSALRSRLSIPILYGADAIHGNGNIPGATIFPHSIGLGAGGRIQDVARATAEEMRAVGMNWSYSPTLDLPQDIRWGRTYEAFTDDPAYASKIATAYICGTQKSTCDLTTSTVDVIATAKHFIGAGNMQWGSSGNKNYKIDQGKTIAGEETIRSQYLPPFKAAVDSGVLSVMAGLNQVGDNWISYNHHLITDVLKNELGFKGFVVSDWYGAYEHSSTQYEGMVKAINAGVDMLMLPFDYKDFVMNMRIAVNNGDIPENRVDDAVRRILYAKFSAGLFERNQPTKDDLSKIGSLDHRKIARDAVASSLVLLKNDGYVLPLRKDIRHIRIAGSAADNVGRQSGAWTVEWQGIDGNWLPGATSILQGIKKAVSTSTVLEYDPDAKFSDTKFIADVGIAVVGEKPYAEGLGDNPNPTLDQKDLDAISNLKAVSKKVIVIIVSGRPLIITNELPKWNALVEAWLPGSEGEGVADVLFGDQPFLGKLPLPWPASIRQLPISLDQKTADGTKLLFHRYDGIITLPTAD